MSTERESSSIVDPIVQPFTDFWASYWKQANDTTCELLEGINGNADVKTWQRRWLDAVSKSMDAYMRSPMFLQAMKQNTDLLVKAKRQADDLATEIARNANIPTASDISGLFERLHSVEEVILGRLERIDERLKTIENQVELEVEADDSPVDNLTAAEAIDSISRMRSRERIDEIIANDGRTTVVEAAKKRRDQLVG